MSTTPTKEQLTATFEDADSILALEGMVKPASADRYQQAVINGEMSFDEAIAAITADAKAQVKAANDKAAGQAQ
jgi:hypothetical protein